MPSNPSQPSGPAWRKPGAGSAGRKSDAQPSWRRERAGTTASSGSGRRTVRLAIAGGGLVLAIGALIFLIPFLFPPPPTGLVLIGAGYRQNLAVPHNAYGMRGMMQVKGWAENLKNRTQTGGFWDRGTLRLVEPVVLKSNSLGEWDKELNKSKEKTLIVYLALHGAVDEKNAPYLFVEDTDYTYSQRLPLLKVLQRLKDAPQENKVLLLDCTQIAAHWPSGMVTNDFAEALERHDAEIQAIPNLVVISASDKDQRSWIDQRWGTTVFSHYVTQGLEGTADADGNGRVTAWELYGYLNQQVPDTVAGLYNNATQKPVLLPRADGERRAKKAQLVQVTAEKREPTSGAARDTMTLPPLEGLAAHWQARQKLQQDGIAVAQHADLWRLYEDTLLRYEQLLRAGEPASDDDLKTIDQKLNRWEERLGQATPQDPASLQNSLAMPAALGIPSGGSSQRFKEIWANPNRDKARTELANWLAEQPEGRDKKLLRTNVTNLLLDETAAKPEQAIPLLNAMGGSLRPAESHFLVMFDYLDKLSGTNPSEDRLKVLPLAVQVRRLAEQAALGVDLKKPHFPAYSSQVRPWIQEKIEAGDRERRLGEDLLYGPKPVWDRAQAHLTKARETYQEASDKAHRVSNALEIRDQTLAEIPYYAQWLARQRTNTPQLVDQLKAVETILENAHQLTLLLEQGTSSSLDQIEKYSALASAGLQGLRESFQRRCQELEQQALQGKWDEIEGVLSTPFIDPALRQSLLHRSRDIAKQFQEKDATSTRATGDSKDLESQAQSYAQQQARMAASLLGNTWIGTCDANLSLRLIQDRIAQANPENWRASMHNVGHDLGRCWRTLPGTVNELTNQGVQEDLKKAGPALTQAARWARLLDGAAADVVNAKECYPVLEHHNLQWHDLLLWQADRTCRDHWFGENNDPYYNKAAKNYLADAEALVKSSRTDLPASQQEARLAAVNAKRKYLASAKELDISRDLERWDLTSERSLALNYHISAPEEALPGHPAFWRKVDPQYLGIKDSKPETLSVIEDFAEAKQPRYSDRFEIENRGLQRDEAKPPSRPEVVKTKVTYGAVLRGHVLSKDTPIDIHRVPDVAASQYPRPPVAGVEVRADAPTYERYASRNGAIVIILDCSDSMTTKQPDGSTRFHQVKVALKRMLRAIPPGARISVWAYGQKKAGAMQVPDDAERTIERLHPEPIVWNPNNPNQINGLEDEIEKLEPYNWTPIVRSMMDARQDLRGEGLKTMIILTDGMDTRFEEADYDIGGGRTYHCTGDPVYNPNGKEKISTFIPKAFRDSGIQINIVGFQLGAEEERAKGQFQKTIEALPIPGKFALASETNELVSILQRTLQQRLRYTLEKLNGYPVEPHEGVEVTSGGRNAKWTYSGIAAGSYTVKARAFRQPVLLDPGDFLLMTLTRNGFQRALFADDFPGKPRDDKQNDWLSALLQNSRKPDGSLQMMATLESKAVLPTVDGTVKQLRPSFVWFEVKAAKPAQPLCLRWSNLGNSRENYPAPAWGMDVAEWPANPDDGKWAIPEVEAWWIADGSPEMVGPLKPDDPQKPLETYFKNRSVRVDGKEVVIESVLFEERATQGGKSVPCLVVRLRYPTNEPVVVRLSGIDLPSEQLGNEQRIYAQANKTTAIFSNVPRSLARNIELNLIPLNALKNGRAANNRPVYHSKFDRLTPPTGLSHDDRPEPIQVNTANNSMERP